MQKGLLVECHLYALIKNDEDEILLLRSADGKQKLMFPGGTLEKGETLYQALVREVKEETGLEIRVNDVIYVDLLENKNSPQLAVYFRCEIIKGDLKLSVEHMDFSWQHPDMIKFKVMAHPDLVKIVRLTLGDSCGNSNHLNNFESIFELRNL